MTSFSKPTKSCFREMDIGRQRVSEKSHFCRWFIEDQWSSLRARQEHEFEQKSNNDVIGAPRADAFLLIFNPFPEAIFC
jgi:hypothetical protein